MEIRLTKRGQALLENLRKNGNPTPVAIHRPIMKEYTLIHYERVYVEGKKKPVEIKWSEKIWVDEARIFPKSAEAEYEAGKAEASKKKSYTQKKAA